MRELESTLALDVRATLGEGLFWDADAAQLWMVDIHGRRLLRWDLRADRAVERRLPHRVGWVLRDQSGRWLVVGLQPGVAYAPLGNPCTIERLATLFDDNPALRFNDSRADRTGRMNNDDEERSDGCLFRLDIEGRLTVADAGYRVANGPAISPDGWLMLHTDSGRRTIYAFDLDIDAGQLSGKRVWRTFAEDEGYPDGMCSDAEGALWVAHWGAGWVSRFDVTGRLLRRVRIPVPLVTNVCFAGPRCDRLFVSTARVGLSAEAPASAPLTGALFEVVAPGVAGHAGNRLRLDDGAARSRLN